MRLSPAMMRVCALFSTLAGVAAGFALPLACGGHSTDSALPDGGSEGVQNPSGSSLPDASDRSLQDSTDSTLPNSVLPDGSGEAVQNPSDNLLLDASDHSLQDSTDSTLPDRASSAKTALSHRATAVACTQPRPPGSSDGGLGGWNAGCVADKDCINGQNGRCSSLTRPTAPCGVGSTNECTYDDCASDRDCDSGVCSCAVAFNQCFFNETRNICIRGNCQTDSDCGSGGYCSLSGGGGCYASGYFCHTAQDGCVNDDECDGGGCEYDPSASRWVCLAFAAFCRDG